MKYIKCMTLYVQNNYKKETQNDQLSQIAFMISLSGYFHELCHTATGCPNK